MEIRFAIIYTLYAHNLSLPHRSFAPDLSVKDFEIGKNGVYKEILSATKVKYVNPRGESIILFDKTNHLI